MKKIILIDGNSLMFRSFYATYYMGNLMQNKNGLYTNAIFGFCNMLNKLQGEEKTHIFVAFDAGKKTLRHQHFTAYKGTRKALPDELRMQIPYIKRYLDILGIKRYEMDDYEADDLIGTFATSARLDGFDEVKVITGDKDLLQLVKGQIKVFITRKGASELEEFNEENFYEKMRIYPHQIPDYKGLVGDVSDNLPGIKGIGEKTATKLLGQFQSLEAIIANASLIGGKTQQLIEAGYQDGLACKQLATLEVTIPLDFGLDQLKVKDYNAHELIAFFQEMGFDSFIKKIDVSTEPVKHHQVKLATVEEDFSKVGPSSIICEIFGSDYYRDEVLGLAVWNETQQVFASKEVLLHNPSLQTYLRGDVAKTTFDAKRMLVSMARLGLEVNHIVFDSLLATYIIDPSKANEEMKPVFDAFLINDLHYDEDIYGSKSKAKIPSLDLVANHALMKAKWNHDIELLQRQQLHESDQEALLELELALSSVLARMELHGLLVNQSILRDIELELTDKQLDVVDEIYDLAGEHFNINSVKQLNTILFEKLNIPSGKKNKTGYSTAVDVLEKLAPNYVIVAKILEYRAITKIITTYLRGMAEVMDHDHYIHPLYKQALTSTGRLSSVSPNIQNMPIRTELGQVIRKAFVSRFAHGHIMSSDYSQIELRVLAHFSQDETMIRMFAEEIDFHKQTAAEMYEVPLEEVTKEMRRTAKAINFGIIYGISAWGLAKNVGISNHQAEEFIKKYFETFPKVKTFLDQTVADAHLNGLTKTILNRVRFITELKSDNKALVAFGERTAMNSPIQGSAADLIKVAMVRVQEAMKGLKSLLIAQVHDELVFDVYPGEEKLLSSLVRKEMEGAMKLLVPIKVEIGIGPNWLET